MQTFTQEEGIKILDVSKLFSDGDMVHDAYSDQSVEVKNGKVILENDNNIALLELVD